MAENKMVAERVQNPSPPHNALIGLRSPGLLARVPMIGLAMFLFGTLVFAGLIYNLLAQGPLLAWDKVIANTLPAIGLQGPAYLKTIMDSGFYLGKDVIEILDILLVIYFLLKRYWQELAMLAIGMVGSTLLFSFLSNYFARPRPATQIWIIVDLPGFPSGHAIAVVVFYGFLAYLLVPKMPSAFWKGVVVAAALFIIGFVGFSRIFTGGHYLTDVLAGYAVGLAWSGLIYTLIEIIFKKFRSHNVKKDEIHAG